MRVLFTFVGGTGPAEPMVPVAAAFRAAGHTVAFAGHADPVRHLDFERIVTAGSLDGPPPERRPLVEPDQAHEQAVIRTHFAGSAARARAERYREVFADWRPDLVVRDELDFGAARRRRTTPGVPRHPPLRPNVAAPAGPHRPSTHAVIRLLPVRLTVANWL